MNKTTTSTGVIEFVNLALAIFSWLFSDIQFSLKVAITAVLIGIIVLSKFQPTSWLSRLSIKPTVILFGIPIVTSIAMFYLASLCYSKDLLSILSLKNRPLPLGLVYALLISLPIVIISVTLSKRKILDLNLGLMGSIVWFFSIYGLVSLDKDFNIWRMSIYGPVTYALAGNQCEFDSFTNNDWVMILSAGVSVILIPIVFYFFGSIWKSKNSLMWK